MDGGQGAFEHVSGALSADEAAAMTRSGQLNPEWVELLMGWPLGWTSLEPCAGIWPGWPACMGPDQHSYEPPRTVAANTIKSRAARLKMLGNGVVEQQAQLAFFTLFRIGIGLP